MEYSVGTRRNFVFIPEEMDGKWWKKMVVAMREAYGSLENGRKISLLRYQSPT